MNYHKTDVLPKTVCLLNILLPLLAGLSVYVLLRPDSYISLFLSGALHLAGPDVPNDIPPDFLRLLNNFGPDICWSYSLVFAVHMVLHDLRRPLPATLCLSGILIILIESLQKISILPGVFDPLDLVLEAAAAINATLILALFSRKHRRNTNEKENSDLHEPRTCPRLIHRNGRGKRIVG